MFLTCFFCVGHQILVADGVLARPEGVEGGEGDVERIREGENDEKRQWWRERMVEGENKGEREWWNERIRERENGGGRE